MRRRWPSGALLAAFVALAFFAAPARGGFELKAQEAVTSISSAAGTPIPKTYAAGADAAKSERKAGTIGKKAWRALVTSAGAFPFAYFYTNFIFDGVRFVENGFDAQYAPWPFKTQYSADVSVSETFVRLGVSLGMSAVVGLLDALVQH
jgi:hypothetical protein